MGDAFETGGLNRSVGYYIHKCMLSRTLVFNLNFFRPFKS